MGFMDKIKGMFGGHKDTVVQGVDKATDVVDQKTGGKLTEPLKKVDEAAPGVADKVLGDDAK